MEEERVDVRAIRVDRPEFASAPELMSLAHIKSFWSRANKKKNRVADTRGEDNLGTPLYVSRTLVKVQRLHVRISNRRQPFARRRRT